MIYWLKNMQFESRSITMLVCPVLDVTGYLEMRYYLKCKIIPKDRQ
jgi:hypothetical protein